MIFNRKKKENIRVHRRVFDEINDKTVVDNVDKLPEKENNVLMDKETEEYDESKDKYSDDETEECDDKKDDECTSFKHTEINYVYECGRGLINITKIMFYIISFFIAILIIFPVITDSLSSVALSVSSSENISTSTISEVGNLVILNDHFWTIFMFVIFPVFFIFYISKSLTVFRY